MKYWNKRGKSSGSIVFEPTKDTLYKVRDWVHKRDPVKYWEWYFALDDKGNKYKRDHKFRMLKYNNIFPLSTFLCFFYRKVLTPRGMSV